MNERHPSSSVGSQMRRGLWIDTKPPHTSPIHTSANQETRSDKPPEKNERMSKSWGRRNRTKRSSWAQTLWDRWEFSDLATGGQDHIQNNHMYTDWNPSELAGSDHNPLPPPPHSGKDITATQAGQPIQTQNHHSHPHPPFQNPPSSLFLSSRFLCSFHPLCLLLFVPFFKLVYRTRREAAWGKELSLLSFDDVIGVVVPRRTLFSDEKKASSFFMSFFLFSVCLDLSPVFVNDNKKDLPLNVQDVFSHTWTGF